jgi:phage tail sheath protein FI
MAQKRFGPTRGAGVVVIEKEGDKTIEPGALGMVGYGGVLERGPVGELVIALDKATFERVFGGYIPDSLLPDNCFDYYDLANGAGGILVVRVTDGNEVQASIPVYTRHLPRVQLGTLRAHNGGRWGGKRAYYTNDTTLLADIDEFTIDTGITTWTTDQWKGGYVELAGVPNVRYTITGNDDTGLITVEADSTMASDLAGGADPTNQRYYLVLENEAKELAVLFEDGQENPTTEFGISVTLDGDVVYEKPNLSTDPNSGRYWVNVINDDTSNYFVEAVDTYTGSHVPDARPANHYGEFTALTATVLTATIHEFAISSAGGGDPTFALGSTTDDHKAQTITLDMTAATTFNASSDLFGDLGSGTLGVLFEPNNAWTPPFTVTAGANPLAAVDTLTIVYKPFLADSLVNGFLYPDKDTDRRLRYRIVSNTHSTITVAAGSDMATDVGPIAGVAATGSIVEVAQADHVDGETLVLEDTVGVVVTFYYDVTGTFTPGGGYDATNVQLDISGDTTASDVATTVRAAINAAAIAITAGGAAGNITLAQDNTGAAGNNAILETVADADYVVAGFTLGVTATEDEFMVEAYLAMGNGRDGNADLVDADYNGQLWDTSSSPFLQVAGKNLGLIKFATPGITATAVQKAGVAYATARNHQYRYEVPENILTEQAVDEYVNDTLGRSDYAVVSWPSRGHTPDPESTDNKLKLVPLTGMIHGREAQMARTYDGYHKAQSDITATLPRLLKIPTGDRVLNEEYLNPLGINVIKKTKGNFVLWGDRTLWLDPTWKFKHQRELMSYYEQVLQENFDFIIFAINDPETQDIALTTLTAFFLPEFVKRAIRGKEFTDAAKIKIDHENNTDLTRAAGDMYADISLRLADTVERFIMRIGKQGIFESVA